MESMYECNFNLLAPLAEKVEVSVLKFMIVQYNKTMYCDLEPQPDGSFHVRSNNHTTRCDKVGGKWECACQFARKTGLPCCHLMKILLVLEISVLDYVDDWWLIGKEKV